MPGINPFGVDGDALAPGAGAGGSLSLPVITLDAPATLVYPAPGLSAGSLDLAASAGDTTLTGAAGAVDGSGFASWDLSALPDGRYTGRITATTAAGESFFVAVVVVIQGGFPAPDRVASFSDDLSGDLLNGCEPLRLFQGDTSLCTEWATDGLDASGATLTLLAVPRRRRSTTFAFENAVMAVASSPATLRAFLPAGWELEPGPYWFRVRCEGGPGGVTETSPVLVMVSASPAPTAP